MFEGPDHAPYIQLCRELRLERVFEEGDWLWKEEWFPEGDNDGLVGICAHYDGGLLRPGNMTDEKTTWLPRLDQWLAKLDNRGYPAVAVGEFGGPPMSAYIVLPTPDSWAVEDAPEQGVTREEAAARLWMAVAGRTVPA